MGVHVIRMPDIGEGIAEVELVTWHVKPGDSVLEDQPLADVMTDKATVEIPSSVAGKVLALGGTIGQVMAVGSELIRIEVEGAGNLGAASSAAASAEAPAAPAVLAASPAPAPAPAPVAAISRPAPERWRPWRRQRGRHGKPATSRWPRRQCASVRGISASSCAMWPAAAQRAKSLTPILMPMWLGLATGAAPHTHAAGYAERQDEVALPVIGLRRKIAQKMQESKRRIPHFTYVEEIDMSELEALRVRLNETRGATRGRLTVLPFLMRAVVLALREFPQINARFDDDAGIVTRYGAVHMGIATQTEAGLMVPVVRHAEARDLWSSAAEIARLAEAARNGQAAREELSGSTITITSLGALGGVVSTPVINHPEVAIVGVNRMVLRPVIRDGAVVARQMMNLSSSFDHRVVDGMHAAQFVQALRGLLECPSTLFLD